MSMFPNQSSVLECPAASPPNKGPQSGVFHQADPNPIQQRLFLYRFAFLHLDPVVGLCPELLSLPGLQYLPGNRDLQQWDRLLQGCFPFTELGNGAVISPSLTALLRLRKYQPMRPLIFCCTAFEPLRSTSYLARLVRRCHPVTWLLHDATDPLFWVSPRQEATVTRVEAYLGKSPHPLKQLADLLRQHVPESLIIIREDGLLLEQGNLFVSRPPLQTPEKLVRSRINHEASFREQFSRHNGACYLFSSTGERLEWFRRDCTRLLDARVYCWNFPERPDPRDPLVHFILAPDAAIRFTSLDARLPGLHLDGTQRHFHYRETRRSGGGRPHWLERKRVEAYARFPSKQGSMLFYYCGKKWRCHGGPSEVVQDRSLAFAQRLEALNLLQVK